MDLSYSGFGVSRQDSKCPMLISEIKPKPADSLDAFTLLTLQMTNPFNEESWPYYSLRYSNPFAVSEGASLLIHMQLYCKIDQ
ncbi:MAG: hypothetical protein H6Q92_1169 [Nitrospirae bacterium]|jgi:hypothetical protein|nr:hypothetical protein [Nitrospirota bacterium]